MPLPTSRPAAAWFAAQSFHSSRDHAQPASAAPVVDTRPRADYVLPDRTVVSLVRDHGEYPQATRSYALTGGEIVQAIRADLLPQIEGTAVRS